jgi:uncharacterized protein YbjT (DUF2867 family)
MLADMPVIVVGADTEPGRAVIDEIADSRREIRVFVSDEDEAAAFRARGLKVALGDVSDESHLEAAARMCFTAVLISEAAEDARVRSFANEASQVLEGWARATKGAGVTRVIWVTDAEPPPTDTPEVATVSPAQRKFAESVAALDEAQRTG